MRSSLSIVAVVIVGCGAPPPVTDVTLPSPAAAEPAPVRPTAAPAPESSSRPLGPLDRERVESTDINVGVRRMAIAIWRTRQTNTPDPDRCPSLDDLVRDHAINPAHSPKDAWGQPVVVRCDDDGTEVRSAGPDRVLGNADDIVSAGPR